MNRVSIRAAERGAARAQEKQCQAAKSAQSAMSSHYAENAAGHNPDSSEPEESPGGNTCASLFDTQLLRTQGRERDVPVRDYFVFVASADGEAVEVLQAPLTDDELAQRLVVGRSIDEVWDSNSAAGLSASISKAIKGRQVQTSKVETSQEHYEFLVVPHGRSTVIAVGWDVSLRAAEMDRMERLAYQDDLTKLPNRQFLLEELERCTDLLKIKQGRAAMLCIDVRGSDTEPGVMADVSDGVISELAARLTHELRGANDPEVTDLDRYSVAARLDHNHFGVLLPSIERGADAEGVAARVVEALREPIRIGRGEIKASVFAGISLFPQDGTDARTLVANAWAAMEDARTGMDEPFKLHSGTVRLRALQRQDLESELRLALEKDEFDVAYLPVVDAESRQVKSIEALFRWPQSSSRPRSIRQIISLAENTGLIMPIGEWVLRKGCEALRSWERSGFDGLRLSVNVSAQEFSRPDLSERIEGILNETGVEPYRLDIEINEYALFRDAMRGYPACKALEALHVGVVLDDYGTGACSLAHVSRSPVSAIKIDRSFVANVAADKQDYNACAGIVALATSLGKETIAEGVESEDQAQILTTMGCKRLQGFLTCEPSSVDAITDLLHLLQELDSA